MKDIAAIIVTFHPQYDLLQNNVRILLKQVSHVIVVDNTGDGKLHDVRFLHDDKSVTILSNEANLGIATALNIGCCYAFKKGYKWAITFDQDSIPTQGFVTSLFKDTPQELDKIGAIGPIYTSFGSLIGVRNKVVPIDSVITSGCLVNLIAFNSINGFKDSLFIDMVDIEFCWRLKQNGYSVLLNGNAVLDHQLGNRMMTKKIFGKLYHYADHSPLRTYYYTRNLLWVTKEYKEFMPHEYELFRHDLKKEIFKIVFVSDKKVKKLVYAFVGLLHYLTKTLGEYPKSK